MKLNTCPVNFDLSKCSSKDYGLTCKTCFHHKKLWEIIKKIEDKSGIDEYYLHRSYNSGKLELNIEFNNDIADDILKENNILEINTSAYWE